MEKKNFAFPLFMCVLAVLLVLIIFVPSIGGLVGTGRAFTDEYCVECGSFRSVSYFCIPFKSFIYEEKPREENALMLLHDTYLKPCAEHRWHIYHVSRGSVEFRGNSHPTSAVSFDLFKHFGKAPMNEFIADMPDIASRAANLVFSYSAAGKNSKKFSDLGIAIEMKDPADINKVLDEMEAELAKP